MLLSCLVRAAAGRLDASLRSLATVASDAHATTLRGFEPGRVQPELIPFQLTPEQAKTRFLEWQRTNFLAPSDLLNPGTYQIRAHQLPFWLFQVQAKVTYNARVGRSRDPNTIWKETGWRELPVREYPWSWPGMQVYASFQFRRDFADMLKPDLLASPRQPLTQAEAQAGEVPAGAAGGGAVALDAPEMRQSMAWEFALRAIREHEAAAVERLLEEEAGGQQVRDVQIRIAPLSRQARLVYTPAYSLHYVYGETFNVHGERRAEHFQAVVSGVGDGGVAGERHFSAHKASLLAGTAFAGVALGTTAIVPRLLGSDPWALVSAEGAFALFFVASAAALAARMVPTLLHQRAEEQRLAAEDADFERVVALGMGPMNTGSDDQEVLRSGVEWRRWEHSDRRGWNAAKRRRWAEELWNAQHRRRKERQRLAQRLWQQQARQQAEEERERRREKRWGRSSHHGHFRHHSPEFSGGGRPGGRHDYLGYYTILGLDPGQSAASASQEDIKKAFRRAALRWHPDQQSGEHAKRAARERFLLVRAAYETLRDPAKRRAYDRGELRSAG